jgi:hypothetical protein
MSQISIYSNQGSWGSIFENSPSMVDGPAIGRFSSGGMSSSLGMSSRPGECGLVLGGDEHFGLSWASSLALSSQCS